MSNDDLDHLRQLLSAALELPPAERPAFVAAQSPLPPDLLAELTSLLALEADAVGFLETSVPASLGLVPLPRPVLTGQRVNGRYLVESLLAESGFATVYLAHDESVAHKPVVLKVLDRQALTDTTRKSFQAELAALAQIQHPGIVGISDTGQAKGGFPYLILQYVPGVSLRQALADGPLPLPRARTILVSLARALAAAHKVGIAHLDLKPENIILSDPGTAEERVTILDFGIARLRPTDPQWIPAVSVRYMAPEQATNPTIRCDVYAFGRIASELCGLNLPHQDPLRDLVLRCLEPNPALRPASAIELRQALAVPLRSPQPWLWPTAVAVCAIAAILYSLLNRPDHYYSTPIPLVTTPGIKQNPALSPDGQFVYYTLGPGDDTDIYRQSTAGGNPIPLVVGPTEDSRPQVLPDGSALAFIRRLPSGELGVMTLPLPPNGQPPRLVMAQKGIDSVAWAPDGQTLIISARPAGQSGQRLYRYHLPTRTTQELLSELSSARLFRPVISPDGRMLAVVARINRLATIYVLPINSLVEPVGPPRPLVELGQRIEMLQWTPDSREIIYLGGTLTSSKLWRVGLESRRPVPAGGGISEAIVTFAVAAKVPKIVYAIDPSDDNVWFFDLASKSAKQVIASTRADEGALISPDGKSLLFASNRLGTQQLWISDTQGENPRPVTKPGRSDVVTGLWTPDSRAILFSDYTSRSINTYLAPLTLASEPKLLLPGASVVRFSRDMSTLYYRFRNHLTAEIWRAPYPALQPATRLPLPEAQFLDESWDGKSYYFTHQGGEDGLFRYRLPNGPVERVLPTLLRRTLFGVSAQGIYYVARPAPKSHPALFLLPEDSTQSRLIHQFDREIGWVFAQTPDWRGFYYTQTDVPNQDIQLIDAFR
jgi:Tol biopolymer transport system component